MISVILQSGVYYGTHVLGRLQLLQLQIGLPSVHRCLTSRILQELVLLECLAYKSEKMKRSLESGQLSMVHKLRIKLSTQEKLICVTSLLYIRIQRSGVPEVLWLNLA